MRSHVGTALGEVLAWCTTALGPVKVLADHTRHHDSDLQATVRIETSLGICYAKIHANKAKWEQEVHGYERWAHTFGSSVPQLLAIRDEPPLAIVVSEHPGKILEEVELASDQERAVWRAAGKTLVALHELAIGEYFGPCHRDGTCAGKPIGDAVEYVSTNIQNELEHGLREGYLDATEQATIHAALALTPAFAGQDPVPCHYDYCPANWLVTEDGVWSGVIDFERSHWDIPASDFTRDPDWNWIERPDLMEAFFEGYGRISTPETEQQRLVADTYYALETIVWASRVGFHGSLREGREALAHIAKLLG